MNGCAEPVTALPLDRAGLCLDCDHVVELQGACPACSSESVVSLARWMNREGR
jgi:hypothetical protein